MKEWDNNMWRPSGQASDRFVQEEWAGEIKSACIGVIGLGYVGLPLALSCASLGHKTIGYDIDGARLRVLNSGKSGQTDIPDQSISNALSKTKLAFSSSISDLAEADAIIICVPTPLNDDGSPDLTMIRDSVNSLRPVLRQGQLIVLESTTWPGTTEEVVRPLLEKSGFKIGEDLFLAYSPERIDPGNQKFDVSNTPKVVGADEIRSKSLCVDLYRSLGRHVVPVSSTRTAEAVKLLENSFRLVNIALINEFKSAVKSMDIDVWEAIDAASTKPFGFMPFQPGPGIGGHCIPVDPSYLLWRVHENGGQFALIELAIESVKSLPKETFSNIVQEIEKEIGVCSSELNLLMIGVAYKKNISDIRESPAIEIFDLASKKFKNVDFHDPHVACLKKSKLSADFEVSSVPITPSNVSNYDAIVVTTDHDDVNWKLIANYANLIVDTRNVFSNSDDNLCRIIKV